MKDIHPTTRSPIERRPNVSTPSSRVPTDESRFKKNTHTETRRGIVRAFARSHAPWGGSVEVLRPGASGHPDVARRGAGRRRNRRRRSRSRSGRDVDGARERARGGKHDDDGRRGGCSTWLVPTRSGVAIDRSIARSFERANARQQQGPGACGATTGPPLNPSTIYHIIRIKTRSCTIYRYYYSCFVFVSSWYFLYV